MMRTFKFLGFIMALSVIGLLCFSCGNGSNNTENESVSNEENNQLPETQNHKYVDLGLPSGTLWATYNVGADSPEGYGSYFAWGETTTKNNYEWSNYLWGKEDGKVSKYCDEKFWGYNGFTDTRTVLEPKDDAATMNWGKGWRIPTEDEMVELIDNCTNKWTKLNGVNGIMLTGPNGNSIFLPANGYRDMETVYDASTCYYWTSTLYTANEPYMAYSLIVGPENSYVNVSSRARGLLVRAVCR